MEDHIKLMIKFIFMRHRQTITTMEKKI